MATINHIRLARLNRAFADECEHEHAHRLTDPRHKYSVPAKPDPYTRRSNICPVCHTTRSTGTGECLC